MIRKIKLTSKFNLHKFAILKLNDFFLFKTDLNYKLDINLFQLDKISKPEISNPKLTIFLNTASHIFVYHFVKMDRNG